MDEPRPGYVIDQTIRVIEARCEQLMARVAAARELDLGSSNWIAAAVEEALVLQAVVAALIDDLTDEQAERN